MFSFEIQWPSPYTHDWKRSSRSFETLEEAIKEMAEFVTISGINGTMIISRAVELTEFEIEINK